MVVERAGHVADPDLQVAVADHVAQEGLVQHHLLVELEQQEVVATAGVVDGVGVVGAVAFGVVGHAQAAAIGADIGLGPGAGGVFAGRRR